MRNVLFLLLVAILAACQQKPQHTFTNELLLPMTPVKDQGKSELCWAYAMLATIETEHLVRGDSVNLSPQYLGRMLKRKNQRAMCQTALNLLQRYGVVGFDVMPDDATDDLPTPKNVFLLGAKYTPLEFAHSVCAPDEYISLTSFPDSPYYQKIDVPIPDNWEHNRLLNVPLDTLRRHVYQALKRRHPVCFESRGHAMAIVGMARDENRHAYYILKNSWGTDQPHGGLVYMPVRRLWHDAVAIYMTRDAYEGR
jgi:bleomycin hydrolase